MTDQDRTRSSAGQPARPLPAGAPHLRRSPRALLLLASAAIVLGAAVPLRPGHAATPAATQRKKARPADRHAAARPPAASEDITVTGGMATANGVTNTTPGGGLMAPQTVAKSRSTITRDFIAKQSPTTNAIAMIANLPGVVAASTDPLGQSTTAMSMRGLMQTEIGFTYEDMPIADSINYTPYVQAAVDTDNIAAITVNQGAPDITSPVYNDVGGLLKITLRHAADNFGGTANLSYGSKSLEREFIRLDSGELGHSGIKAFASFSSTTNDEWRGSGTFRKYHVDSEIRKDWTPDTSLAFILSYDNWQQGNYRPMTMAAWHAYGINYNYDKDYTRGDYNWIGLNQYTRRSLIMMLPFKARLADGLHVHLTPSFADYEEYYFGGTNINNTRSWYGNQPAGNLNLPAQFTLNGVPGEATVEQINPVPQKSFVLDSGLSWEKGNNIFQAGYSYNYVDLLEQIWYEGVNAQGGMANHEGAYPIRMANGVRYNTLDQHFQHQMNALYVSDTLKLLGGRLVLNAGLKYLMIFRDMVNRTPGAIRYAGGAYAQPLPQISASYRLTPHDQIYLDATTAYRAPASVEAYGQLFSPGRPGPTSSFVPMTGEYAIGEEIGYRHYGLVNVALALFNYNITNNQVTSNVYIGNLPIPEPIQAGGKTSRGAQVELGLRPWHHVSPYVSAQYLHATMDNNFATNGVLLPTAGKTAVQSPEVTAAIGLSYDNGSVFGNFSFNYIGAQYATLMNDQKMPSYETANMTLGYRFHSVGFARHPQIQMNIVNIGAENYLSGIQSVTANAHPVVVGGHTIAGAAPLYLVGGGIAVIGSVSTAF
ncbi:TonB-dependent receptor [Nguyenibacter vanlangensis]|uniref:TonB-dependent receptor n=1 Tax=Nguyenibacter vanlangensis TaxID=1216886 RepID=A0ABZ3D326_9PROT